MNLYDNMVSTGLLSNFNRINTLLGYPFQFLCLIQYDFWFFKSVAFALWFASFLKKRFIWLIYF